MLQLYDLFFTRITIKQQWQYKIYKFKVLCKFLSYFCFCCLNHVVSNKTEADTPILWPPDMKNWLIWKDPDAGKDWGLEQKGTTEDEMIGWHHQLDGHEFEQALGVSDGQGRLACCSPWGSKESDTTEWLNWTELNIKNVKRSIYKILNMNNSVHNQMRHYWSILTTTLKKKTKTFEIC